MPKHLELFTTLNISLPRSMREFIESERDRLGFATASQYMRSLIRQAQERSPNAQPAENLPARKP
jgi:Arc/MetJ-type ribon-helix-helix transcriptional regulator